MMSAPITPQPVITVVPLNPALVNKAGLPNAVTDVANTTPIPALPLLPLLQTDTYTPTGQVSTATRKGGGDVRGTYKPAPKPSTIAGADAVQRTIAVGLAIAAVGGLLWWGSRFGSAAVPAVAPPAVTALKAGTLVTAKSATLMAEMHQVFAKANQFVPYNVLVVKPPAKQSANLLTRLTDSVWRLAPLWKEQQIATNYAKSVEVLRTAENVYLGDLHASWNKLLGHLAMMEVIQMPPETAQEFIRIHRAMEVPQPPEAVHQLIKDFKTALATVQVVDDTRGLHLVGDIVGDRGQNDIFTLLLLKKCEAVIKSRVFSNHDFAAIELYQNVFIRKEPIISSHIEAFQIHSAIQAYAVAQANISPQQQGITLEELKHLYEDHFKQLTLLQYDADTATLSIHNAFNPNKVPALLEAFIPNQAQRTAVATALAMGNKQAYMQAVQQLNAGFKQCVAQQWLTETQASEQLLETVLAELWYRDARRTFQAAAAEDKAFPFYNPNAVTNIAFGHSGGGKETAYHQPTALETTTTSAPHCYLLDNIAAKGVGAMWHPACISRVFIPPMAGNS